MWAPTGEQGPLQEVIGNAVILCDTGVRTLAVTMPAPGDCGVFERCPENLRLPFSNLSLFVLLWENVGQQKSKDNNTK